MYTGHRYSFFATLHWSKWDVILPAAWAAVVTASYEVLEFRWLSLPWLPISAVAVAVAFYLGFKNNASYDRLWEARKIWGGIVNTSRAWAYGVRDLLAAHGGDDETVRELVTRHAAWMDALRFQLRKPETWEHGGYDEMKKQMGVPEFNESLEPVLGENLAASEVEDVTSRINPALHIISNQSRALSLLRRDGKLDGFSHVHLQSLLDELIALQGKAERIKKFPFPRQYATVNWFFAVIFTGLLPMGLIQEFSKLGAGMAWAAVPFTALVGWVFLTTNKIGEWSENPFEGLHNDVPISSMSRGIERDIREVIGDRELPPARTVQNNLMF